MTDIYSIVVERPVLQGVAAGRFSPTVRAASDQLNLHVGVSYGGFTGSNIAHGVLTTDTLGSGRGCLTAPVVQEPTDQILSITISTSEPKIPGSDVPVFRIAALLEGGFGVTEVMEDFPSLREEQINYAREYAKRHRNYWKQYQRTSFKRLLRSSGFIGVDATTKARRKKK